MTTETLPEATEQEVIPQPEAELTQAEEPTPSAPEEITESSDDVESYLKEKGLAVAETQDSTEEGQGSEDQNAWLNELPEGAKEKVEALLENEKQAQERQKAAQTEGRKRVFQNTAQSLRKFLNDQGLDPQSTERVVNTFTTYHGYSLQFAQEEVTDGYTKALYDAASKHLPTAERDTFKAKQHENNDSFFKDLVDSARKGYVKDSALAKDKADAVTGYRDWLLEKPERIEALRSRAKAPELNGSGGTHTGSMTLDQIDKMPNSQWLQIGSTDADGGHSRRQKILDDARTRGR